MNALEIAKNRHTCKAYDRHKKIDPATLAMLLECLRLSPSSINIQPWRFLLVSSDDAKRRVASSMLGADAHNAPKVLNASDVLVFCRHTQLGQAHLDKVLQAEQRAGRFANQQSYERRKQLCQMYLQQYSACAQTLTAWITEQVFIALGHFLLSAQMAGVQATAIGGFNQDLLNHTLGLHDKHLSSVVVVALGYASDDDINQHLPKARLASEDIFENIW